MAELLYKLREWLTVPDAAEHLSIAFGEEVTEAEVLHLALDGHLTLSVNFVIPMTGQLGRLVRRGTAERANTNFPICRFSDCPIFRFAICRQNDLQLKRFAAGGVAN